MLPDTTITGIAHVIQLAVAPVFLLSGIAGMLAVMMSRLTRIVDRARRLEDRHSDAGAAMRPSLEAELQVLARRARSIGHAITLSTVTALLVCTVIVTLFLGAFLHFNPYVPVAVTFIAAMLAFFAGLLSFLREVLVATAKLRFGLPPVEPGR